MLNNLPKEIIFEISLYLNNEDYSLYLLINKYCNIKNYNNLTINNYLYRKYNTKNLIRLIEDNNFDGILWFHKYKSNLFTNYAMDVAARCGHLNLVKWFHENRTEGCTVNAMDIAALNGHLDIIKFLHENRSEGCSSYARTWSYNQGHIEINDWLHKNIKHYND